MKFVALLFVCFSFQTLFAVTNPDDTAQHIKEIRKGNFLLVNPLLDCYDLGKSNLREMIALEKQIKEEINKHLVNKSATYVSVYYRDLLNGHWIGINETQRYSPASLLKLPILIAALKQAEEDSSFLSRRITINAVGDKMKQNLGTNNFSLEAGNTYTIDDLLNYMIIFSDNQCKNIVVEQMDQKYLMEIFYDLGIDINKYKENEDFLSVKEYATYYRLLFNATYLTKMHSNYALYVLSKSRFKKGIVAGVPDSVTVAHKFGERAYSEGNLKQLHDCGIIYVPNKPYLLCVMVKGSDFMAMEKVISGISKILYNNKSQRKGISNR